MSSPETQETRIQRLEEEIQKLKQMKATETRPGVSPQAAEQLPRFDWKWFLTVSLPLFVPLFTAGVIGYFHIKTNLGILQGDARHMQSGITRIESNLDKTNKRIDALETKLDNRMDALESRMQAFEVRLVKVEGNLERINENLDTLKKKP
jgi:flagellar motility protein MotE (MotC chaperone)